MEKKFYTRIDNRLVLEMVEPNKEFFKVNSSSSMMYESHTLAPAYYQELQKYNSRPSYPINPSDEHLFKEGERYELGKDFELKERCFGVTGDFCITEACKIS